MGLLHVVTKLLCARKLLFSLIVLIWWFHTFSQISVVLSSEFVFRVHIYICISMTYRPHIHI